MLGVTNGPIRFKSARKIWPLLELLAKKYTGARLLVLAKCLQLLSLGWNGQLKHFEMILLIFL